MTLRILSLTLLVTLALLGASPVDARPADAPDGSDAASQGFGQGVALAMPEAAGTGAVVPPEADLAYHIVLLEGEPLAGYSGGVRGLEGTSPAATGDARLDTDSSASDAYLAHLDAVQDAAVDAIEDVTGAPADVLFRYRYATNGMAVRLTGEEARLVADLPGVLAVEPNTPRLVDTDAGPTWIGAPAVWDGSALASEVGAYGEGVVVGVVDTGINMDHPSFAEVDERGYEHLNPKGEFLGQCNPDDQHYNRRLKCNDKLIGVHSFLTSGQPNRDPEDDHGHGSHTASTAAGNFVTTEYGAPTTSVTLTFSGVAPHANIVAYDACYNSNGQGVCPPAATLAALDQATKDGVDVVNYSIATGNASPWLDAHALAFKRMREAGIVAAVSAGNSGPGAGTTGAISPWVMAVGATTHDRSFGTSLVDLSGGEGSAPDDIGGRGLTAGYGPAPIVYAGNGEYDTSGGDPDNGSCLLPFPPRTFDGEIVVCDRGEIARVDKGSNVLAGGAGGLVLANKQSDGASITGDGHVLPAVHVTYEDGVRLKAWLADGTGHMATITGAETVLDADIADVMAGFSSRGPASSAFGGLRPGLDTGVPQIFSVLKPDLVAPGVDIIAAFLSDGQRTEPEMESAQGTSMSSPHTAGAAALLRSAHPDWSPAEIQSALMSTAVHAGLRKEDGERPAGWFDQGAGRIDVGRAAAAGLVLDISTAEFNAANPSTGGDPRELNLASLMDTRCLDRCRWTRTVRSTLDRAATWKAAAPDGGVPVTFTPSEFTIEPGGTQIVRIEADARALRRDAWAFGAAVLESDDALIPSARLPIAVYTVSALIPAVALAEADNAQGSLLIGDLRAGDADELHIGVHGLVLADRHSIEISEDPTPNNRYDRPDGTHTIWFEVPKGAKRLAVEVTSSEASDVDLFVGFDSNGDGLARQAEQRCTSLSSGWAEYCELTGDDLSDAGTYWAMIQNYDGSRNRDDEIEVAAVVVDGGDVGNLTVRGPSGIVMGEAFDLEMEWDLPGIAPGDRWLGVVELGTSPSKPSDIGTIMVDIIGVESAPTPTTRPPTATPEPPTATATHTYTPRPTTGEPDPRTPTTPPDPVTPTATIDPWDMPYASFLPWLGKRAD